MNPMNFSREVVQGEIDRVAQSDMVPDSSSSSSSSSDSFLSAPGPQPAAAAAAAAAAPFPHHPPHQHHQHHQRPSNPLDHHPRPTANDGDDDDDDDDDDGFRLDRITVPGGVEARPSAAPALGNEDDVDAADDGLPFAGAGGAAAALAVGDDDDDNDSDDNDDRHAARRFRRMMNGGRHHRNDQQRRRNKNNKNKNKKQLPFRCFCHNKNGEINKLSREAFDRRVVTEIFHSDQFQKEEWHLPWDADVLPATTGHRLSWSELRHVVLFVGESMTDLLNVSFVCRAWRILMDRHPAWRFMLPLRSEIVGLVTTLRLDLPPIYERRWFFVDNETGALMDPSEDRTGTQGSWHYVIDLTAEARAADNMNKIGGTAASGMYASEYEECARDALSCVCCCPCEECECEACEIVDKNNPNMMDLREDDYLKQSKMTQFRAQHADGQRLRAMRSDEEKELAQWAIRRRAIAVDWTEMLKNVGKEKKEKKKPRDNININNPIEHDTSDREEKLHGGGDDANNNGGGDDHGQFDYNSVGGQTADGSAAAAAAGAATANSKIRGSDDDDDSSESDVGEHIYMEDAADPDHDEGGEGGGMQRQKSLDPNLPLATQIAGIRVGFAIVNTKSPSVRYGMHSMKNPFNETKPLPKEGVFNEQRIRVTADGGYPFGISRHDVEGKPEEIEENNPVDDSVVSSSFRRRTTRAVTIPKDRQFVRANHTTIFRNKERFLESTEHRRQWMHLTLSGFIKSVEQMSAEVHTASQLSFLQQWRDQWCPVLSVVLVAVVCLMMSILLGYYYQNTIWSGGEDANDRVIGRNIALMTVAIWIVGACNTQARLDDRLVSWQRPASNAKVLALMFSAVLLVFFCAPAALVAFRVSIAEDLVAGGTISICDAFNDVAVPTTAATAAPSSSSDETPLLPATALPRKLAASTFLRLDAGTKILYHPPSTATRTVLVDGTSSSNVEISNKNNKAFNATRSLITRSAYGYYTITSPPTSSSCSPTFRNATFIILGDFESCPFWVPSQKSPSSSPLHPRFRGVLQNESAADAIGNASEISAALRTAALDYDTDPDISPKRDACAVASKMLVTTSTKDEFFLRLSRPSPHWTSSYAQDRDIDTPWADAAPDYKQHGIVALVADSPIFLARSAAVSPVRPALLESPFAAAASSAWSAATPRGIQTIRDSFTSGLFGLIYFFVAVIVVCAWLAMFSRWLTRDLFTLVSSSLACIVAAFPLPLLVITSICWAEAPESLKEELLAPTVCLMGEKADMLGLWVTTLVFFICSCVLFSFGCCIACLMWLSRRNEDDDW